MADHAIENRDELIDRDLIKSWLLWGFFWILFAPTVGVLVSTKFTYPEFLRGVPELTFGRLRPIHVNGVIFGTFSTLFIGLCYYIVGLWITPAGYVLIYYFLPASVKNPLYSHKLSLIGFWSLALFYPFVGIHHYLYAPIAEWAQTIAIVSSMMLIIPVWTVLQNFFGTMVGRWPELGRNLPAKFLITGSLMYLVGCFQGSIEALR